MPKTKPAAKTINASELAVALAVNRATVTKWKSRGCPHDGKRFDLAAVKAWLEGHGDKRRQRKPDALEERDLSRSISTAPTAPADDPDLLDGRKWSTLYRRTKALQEAIKLRALQGSMIPTEDLDALLVTRALEFRRGLEELEHRLPPLLADTGVREIGVQLRQAFRRLLERYSRPTDVGKRNGKAPRR